MEHKELRQVLDAMIHAARLSFDKTGDLPPLAVALDYQGRIRQLALPDRNRSAEETDQGAGHSVLKSAATEVPT